MHFVRITSKLGKRSGHETFHTTDETFDKEECHWRLILLIFFGNLQEVREPRLTVVLPRSAQFAACIAGSAQGALSSQARISLAQEVQSACTPHAYQDSMRGKTLLSQLCRSHTLHSNVISIRGVATSSHTLAAMISPRTHAQLPHDSGHAHPILQQARWHARFTAYAHTLMQSSGPHHETDLPTVQGMSHM